MVEMRRAGCGEASEKEPLWAYAYQLLPPRPADRMPAILELMQRENADALREARSWTARPVTETLVTHVLVLSDAPDLDRDANRRLEAMLRDLEIRYSVTVPMRVDGDNPSSTETA